MSSGKIQGKGKGKGRGRGRGKGKGKGEGEIDPGRSYFAKIFRIR